MKKWQSMTEYAMKRDFFKKLSNWYTQEHRKPLVLRGARQVGKTYGVTTWEISSIG
jgi:predicted AAA+ superfamily ATPase